MYQRLSRQSDKVIHLAHDIARERGDEYVGTEHVLLAIRREGVGLGSRVLEDRGVSLQRIDEQIARLIKSRMEDTWVFGRLPGSPHFRNVVAKAIEEAGKMSAKEVGTEHLLLALLAEEGSVAYNALIALGCRFEEVRQAVVEFKARKDAEGAGSALGGRSTSVGSSGGGMPRAAGEPVSAAGRSRRDVKVKSANWLRMGWAGIARIVARRSVGTRLENWGAARDGAWRVQGGEWDRRSGPQLPWGGLNRGAAPPEPARTMGGFGLRVSG